MPYKSIEKRRENQREYYQRHREERLAYRRSHRAIDRETWKRWAKLNPEQRMAHLRKYKEANPEYTKAYQTASYRRTAEKNILRICSHCGNIENLHVHHKDRDRTNGNTGNLEWLCAPCHRYKHIRMRLVEYLEFEKLGGQGDRIECYLGRLKTLDDVNRPELIRERKTYVSYWIAKEFRVLPPSKSLAIV